MKMTLLCACGYVVSQLATASLMLSMRHASPTGHRASVSVMTSRYKIIIKTAHHVRTEDLKQAVMSTSLSDRSLS